MLNNPFPTQSKAGLCLQSFFPASYFPTFQDLTDFKLEQKLNMWNCTLKSKVCNPPHSYFCPDRWTASWQRVDFASNRVPSQTWREGTCPPPVSSSKWTRGPGICPCIRRSSDKVCHRRYLRKYNSHSENSFPKCFLFPPFLEYFQVSLSWKKVWGDLLNLFFHSRLRLSPQKPVLIEDIFYQVLKMMNEWLQIYSTISYNVKKIYIF